MPNLANSRLITLHKRNNRAKRWPHSRRRSELRRRLDLDILVSVHCYRTMLVNHHLTSARDFSEHRGQWINQTTEAPTITCYDTDVPLEG